LLWGAPAGVLLVGGLAIVLALRRRKDLSVSATTPLTDDETRRLNELAGR
jgi:cytochrome c-type biogenesis protein CcmH/NrfF